MKQLSLNLGLGLLPEQTQDPAAYRELSRLISAVNTVAYGLDIYTGAISRDINDWSTLTASDTIRSGGPNRLYVKFSQAATPGQLINLYNNAGVLNARLAKIGGNGSARGYSTGTVAVGAYGEVILYGLHNLTTGKTPGQLLYTSGATDGAIVTVATAQVIGFALSATEFFFNPALV